MFVEERPEEESRELPSPPKSSQSERREETAQCVSSNEGKATTLQITREGTGQGKLDDVVMNLEQLDQFFARKSNCHEKILFAYSNGTVAGIFVGPSFSKATVKSQALRESLITNVKANGLASHVLTFCLSYVGQSVTPTMYLELLSTRPVIWLLSKGPFLPGMMQNVSAKESAPRSK